MGRLLIDTLIAAPLDRCFDLSLDVNVHQASMRHTRERAIAGVTSGVMALGDQVTWEARHLGRMWQMTSRISAYRRPTRFVDEIVEGPFPLFVHEHIFEPSDGRTRMTDRLEYRLPVGVFGTLADVVAIRRYMRSLLVARNRHIKALAEGAESQVPNDSSVRR